MFWIHLLFIFSVAGVSWSKEDVQNEISDKVKLDANLRKALLDALRELENEDNKKHEHSTMITPQFQDGDFQKATASVISILDPKEPTQSSDTTTTTTTEKSLVVIQHSNGLEQNQIGHFVTRSPKVSEKEEFVASATSSFNNTPRTKSSSPDINSVVNPDVVSFTFKETKQPVETTTVAPIITSSTEESEAKAEDVQFFAAPLVAAFTVHHDHTGLPKSVEPIFKHTQQVLAGEKPTTPQPKKFNEPPSEFYRQEQLRIRKQEQARLELELENKQKLLNQQLKDLQFQQQQRDYLLRQQQLYQDNRFFQGDESKNRFKNGFKSISEVTFEPSITFQPANIEIDKDNTRSRLLPQQLPVKDATNFNTIQRPVISLTPPQISNYQPFEFVRNQQVNRPESETPTFLVNFGNGPQQHRFFRSSGESLSIGLQPPIFTQPDNPLINSHLDNLLVHSGINRGNRQEDFNIVSKVLSLNHLGFGNVNENFFGISPVSERLVPPRITRRTHKDVEND